MLKQTKNPPVFHLHTPLKTFFNLLTLHIKLRPQNCTLIFTVYFIQVHLHGIDCQSFLALLEYLYTDHCMSLERIPVENVLILADQFCLARLVQICESHMHKDLQQILTEACLPDSKEIMDALAFSRVSYLTLFTNTVP